MDSTVVTEQEPEESKPPAPPLNYGYILKFYVPLGLSWMLMAIESPISIRVIAELPNDIILTAAFNAMMALALFVESPVIDLLSTSTTLARNKQAFAELSRFVWYLMIGVTAVHAIIVLTPVYGLVAYTILGLDRPVAEATRVGLAIMIPWSAFIGWRRYLQGVLIRNGMTRLISYGTGLRLCTIASVAIVLLLTSSFSGIVITATALVASVLVEMVYVHIVSRPAVAKLREIHPEPGEQELTIAQLVRFHSPLTLTTMIALAAFPIIVAAISMMPNKTSSLAAWQVAMTLGFLTRSFVFALPEVVITLGKTAEERETLRRFCLLVGLYATGAIVFLCLSGLDKQFFIHIMKKPALAATAHIAFFALCLQPLIGALQSYLRGALTLYHYTTSRFQANIVGVATLIASLAIGVQTSLPSVAVAAIAMTLSLAAELFVLVGAWRTAQARGPKILRNDPLKTRRLRS
ncbi:MAG: hypothetical protein KF784_07305 [Fimbriimonadaceae bacterium]|nr:hypothetical protein [Fimbriimonadaceae bacterium]